MLRVSLGPIPVLGATKSAHLNVRDADAHVRRRRRYWPLIRSDEKGVKMDGGTWPSRVDKRRWLSSPFSARNLIVVR